MRLSTFTFQENGTCAAAAEDLVLTSMKSCQSSMCNFGRGWECDYMLRLVTAVATLVVAAVGGWFFLLRSVDYRGGLVRNIQSRI